MITDSNQACMAKKIGRRVQEVLVVFSWNFRPPAEFSVTPTIPHPSKFLEMWITNSKGLLKRWANWSSRFLNGRTTPLSEEGQWSVQKIPGKSSAKKPRSWNLLFLFVFGYVPPLNVTKKVEMLCYFCQSPSLLRKQFPLTANQA